MAPATLFAFPARSSPARPPSLLSWSTPEHVTCCSRLTKAEPPSRVSFPQVNGDQLTALGSHGTEGVLLTWHRCPCSWMGAGGILAWL